ncbi:hypothetical protein OOZ15_08900 [Galbibacter sp. EGI 63066]|uniref:hypothetical protein n=1 Tax=Galbibacter sp. EGI 63066 TaxID=2993559 RepID=UPI0022495FF2|nr:hypothetical protein [Galbibacter sp. EGI 63066]MCX2680053.1 hypothetical protein [Galbibacter sp. EGI 63066]
MDDIKEEFSIGEYDFSFDKENCSIQIEGNKIVDLAIKANEFVFDNLCESDEFEFGYALYPPEFYVGELDLGSKGHIVINDNNQDHYEIALYFMEHNNVNINLNLHGNWILIAGWTNISGKRYPIVIKMKK